MSKNREEIVEEIITKTKEEIPVISNYRSGGVFYTFIQVVASFLEKIYLELEQLLPNRFLMTAKGKWLDLKAEELSLYRYPASKTRGYVIFSRSDSSRTMIIAKDKIIATKSGLRYKVVADVEFQADESSLSVLVEAENVGSQYNIINGMITEIITPISGIDTITNLGHWVTHVGKDEESDDSLRSRCLALWQGLSGANKSAYIAWAKTVEGIGDVRVLSTARGLGTVDVICVGINNINPAPELINKVRSAINERKPIATDVRVEAPVEILIHTNISVVMLPNYEPSQEKIKDAVQTYFGNMGIGDDFEPSALSGNIIALEGVKSVLVNSPVSRPISELQIIRCGEIALEISNAREN
ncbi:MAG: baseplate J/gp47 family protein [Brevinema sp.]